MFGSRTCFCVQTQGRCFPGHTGRHICFVGEGLRAAVLTCLQIFIELAGFRQSGDAAGCSLQSYSSLLSVLLPAEPVGYSQRDLFTQTHLLVKVSKRVTFRDPTEGHFGFPRNLSADGSSKEKNA